MLVIVFVYISLSELANTDYIHVKFSSSLATLLPTVQERYFGAMPSILYYHGLEHTLLVIDLSMMLAEKANLNQEEIDNLYAAAIFHDTGYAGKYRKNEKLGVVHARKELPRYGFSDEQIECVAKIIWATEYDQEPKTKLERLIKDADLGYMGLKDFMLWSDRLMREYRAMGNFDGSKSQWLTNQIEFLSQHSFHSKEGIALFEEGKQENLQRLRSMTEWPF